jgi:hypothetical protein
MTEEKFIAFMKHLNQERTAVVQAEGLANPDSLITFDIPWWVDKAREFGLFGADEKKLHTLHNFISQDRYFSQEEIEGIQTVRDYMNELDGDECGICGHTYEDCDCAKTGRR